MSSRHPRHSLSFDLTRRGRRPAAALAAMGLLLAAPLGAEDRPAAVVQYRQNVMRSLGNHMSALEAIMHGDVTFPDHAGIHAAAIHGAGRVLPALFPQGTGPDRIKTGAKAEVWADAAGFRAAAARLDAESAKLVTLTSSGDRAALRAQFSVVSKACAACHHGYRLKDF